MYGYKCRSCGVEAGPDVPFHGMRDDHETKTGLCWSCHEQRQAATSKERLDELTDRVQDSIDELRSKLT